jgi:hypothetical protein
MSSERAFGAGVGELDRGRTWRGDDRVRRRSHSNPNELEPWRATRSRVETKRMYGPPRLCKMISAGLNVGANVSGLCG